MNPLDKIKGKRIAWFSSQGTHGVFDKACYLTEKIVPKLSEYGLHVDVYTNHDNHFLTAGLQDKKNAYDLFFHQVQEGKQYHFLRTALGLYPGIIYFHDLYLSDLGPDPLTNSPWKWMSEQIFSNQPTYNWPSRKDEFPRFGPFPQREVSLSLATLTPSVRFCDDISRSGFAKGENYFCPYPIDDTASNQNPPQTNVFSIALIGTPNIEDRVHKLFLALKNLKKQPVISWLLPETDLAVAQKRAQEFGIQVNFETDFSLERWEKLVTNSHLAIQLKFSVFGSLSPFIETALFAKRFVMVTDFGDTDYYPNDVLIKIPAGATESNYITKALLKLQSMPVDALVNSAGHQFISENNNLLSVTDNILSAINQTLVLSHQNSKQWDLMKQNARTTLLTEVSEMADSTLYEKEFKELGWS